MSSQAGSGVVPHRPAAPLRSAAWHELLRETPPAASGVRLAAQGWWAAPSLCGAIWLRASSVCQLCTRGLLPRASRRGRRRPNGGGSGHPFEACALGVLPALQAAGGGAAESKRGAQSGRLAAGFGCCCSPPLTRVIDTPSITAAASASSDLTQRKTAGLGMIWAWTTASPSLSEQCEHLQTTVSREREICATLERHCAGALSSFRLFFKHHILLRLLLHQHF